VAGRYPRPLIAPAHVSAEDSDMREQTSGSVTLVFTDIEGSTLAHVVTCASEVFC
jgi:hypothetical protein